MDLKLATADYSFPLLRWEQTLALARELGMQAIDVSLFANRSHLNPDEALANASRSAARVSAAVRDAGLEIADIFGQPGRTFAENAINDPSSEVRARGAEYFHRILEFTARANGHHLTMLPGVHWESESREDSLKRAAAELAWRCEAAAKLGITLSVEAHVGSIVATPALAACLLQMVPALTLTLDYTHFTRDGIADADVEPLMARASHFHARCACPGRLQVRMRENTIDFDAVLRAMKRVNYEGYFAIEYIWIEWERCDEVDVVSETILLRDKALALAAAL